jgi:GMP synthase (glutamine-hydrolysing)
MPGAKSSEQHFADRPVYDFAIRRWLTDFLDRWCALNHDAAREAATMQASAAPLFSAS